MQPQDWIQLPNLEVRTGVIGVSEVRDGPSNQMLVLSLEPGTYRPVLGVSGTDEEVTLGLIRIIHERTLGGWRDRIGPGDVKRGGVAGWLETNLATAGIVDYDLLKGLVDQDPDGFDAWRAEFYDAMDWPYGYRSFGGDSRVTVFYAQGSGAGERFPAVELVQDGRVVGVEVLFDPVLIESLDESQDLMAEAVERRELVRTEVEAGV